ncbi:MAG TPA: threonine ammonia-lyase [Thermoanaerobaculia bacterium]|nr:threonine ammonia-lyase [Thermoanaerobaculia bacterium]
MLTLDDVRRARELIGPLLRVTPFARSEHFSRSCGVEAYFKLENRHITGSFKERGALHKILGLSEDERQRGVIAASAGNHAQAVAFHATRVGIPSTVVMPRRTPLIKVSNTRDYGAEVVLRGDNFDEAVEHARTLESERGLVFVHPFDDERVIAGQGSVGLELLEQEPELEVVIVPIGGGGLISGISIAMKESRPGIQIVGVQTAALPSMQASLQQKERLTLPPAQTIADGIAVKRPGELTLPIVERYVDDVVTVDEEEIANAILLLLERERTVAEGAAAAALAALYNGLVPRALGRRTCMVLSGGNIDVNLVSRIIERGLAKDFRRVSFEVLIQDQPGSLAALLRLVAEAEANVLEVHHERTSRWVDLGEVCVALTLETRGEDHLRSLTRTLLEAGLEVRDPAT